MERYAFGSFCGLVMLTAWSVSAPAKPAPNWVTLNAKGNVRSFYGIPINLTRAGLRRLHFKTRIYYVWPEGNKEAVYKVTARNNVEVHVSFDEHGRFYWAKTTSNAAIGPRGIRIGSRLSEVRSAWPKGRFGYGCEDGGTPTYITGTNVMFDFDWKDLPPRTRACEQLPDREIPDMKVKSIRILSMAIG